MASQSDPTPKKKSASTPLGRAFASALRAVLKHHDKAESKLSSRRVHRLRVALRRCRTVAGDAAVLDPSGHWTDLRGLARELFQPLGRLRDLQVSLQFARTLLPEDQAICKELIHALKKEIRAEKEKAAQAVRRFDRRRWKRWAKGLPERLAEVQGRGEELSQIARNKLEEVMTLHRQAARTSSPEIWHDLRIAYKRLRYSLENFFPDPYAEWGPRLAEIQDVLGELHDLDVLRDRLKSLHPERRLPLEVETRISEERGTRMGDYRSLVGPDGLDLRGVRRSLSASRSGRRKRTAGP